MNPHEALLALIAADQNRTYAIGVMDWAYAPRLADTSHHFETKPYVSMLPGIGGVPCSQFYGSTVADCVAQAVAAMAGDPLFGQPSAAQGATLVAAVEPASTCNPEHLPVEVIGEGYRLVTEEERKAAQIECEFYEPGAKRWSRFLWADSDSITDGWTLRTRIDAPSTPANGKH